MEIFKKVSILLDNLINLKVSKVIAGGGNGSTIVLFVNDCYSIFIFCCWRYVSSDNKIVTWNDSPDALVGEIPVYLKQILNIGIKKIALVNNFDLCIEFYNGASLMIFSELTVSSGIEENWCLADIKSNECFNMTNEFCLTLSKYDDSIG